MTMPANALPGKRRKSRHPQLRHLNQGLHRPRKPVGRNRRASNPPEQVWKRGLHNAKGGPVGGQAVGPETPIVASRDSTPAFVASSRRMNRRGRRTM